MNKYYIKSSQLNEYRNTLCAGDMVYLSGEVYTARDSAHKRLKEMLEDNKELPIALLNKCIYYAGPTQKPMNLPIGSCGPTTSKRMDVYTPELLNLGLVATIGKGDRSRLVYEAIKRNNALYLCAIGGAGALAAKHIVSCEEVAFKDLGCESIKKLVFDKFPLIVGITSKDSVFV